MGRESEVAAGGAGPGRGAAEPGCRRRERPQARRAGRRGFPRQRRALGTGRGDVLNDPCAVLPKGKQQVSAAARSVCEAKFESMKGSKMGDFQGNVQCRWYLTARRA